MPEMKRHVGKIKNTDKRCVVVYMQIPGKEDHALVVDTDSLPERHHEELMSIVEHEGQRNTTLADVLGRRMSTHSGMDILNTLHTSGYLQPVKTDLVEMHPMPGRKIDLNKVIEMTGSNKSQWDPSRNENPTNAPGSDQRQPTPEELMEASEAEGSENGRVAQPAYDPSQDPGVTSTETVGDDPNAAGYNRILENQQVDKQEQMQGVAKNMIVEAEMLEQEAQQKRNRAYELAPSLKPKPKQTQATQSKSQSTSKSSSSSGQQKSTSQSSNKKSPGRPKKSESQSKAG